MTLSENFTLSCSLTDAHFIVSAVVINKKTADLLAQRLANVDRYFKTIKFLSIKIRHSNIT